MTEREWLACNDVKRMLKFLRGRASERKLRLFACALLRPMLSRRSDERSRRAVEVSERYADGRADKEEVRRARAGAVEAVREWSEGLELIVRAWSEEQAGSTTPESTDDPGGTLKVSFGRTVSLVVPRGCRIEEYAWKITYLRRSLLESLLEQLYSESKKRFRGLKDDLFGNPFRPVAVDPRWLACKGRAVEKLAAAIYEGRRFSDLPILADALEEAGCDNVEILAHCRGGEHARGCWLIDALLKKG